MNIRYVLAAWVDLLLALVVLSYIKLLINAPIDHSWWVYVVLFVVEIVVLRVLKMETPGTVFLDIDRSQGQEGELFIKRQNWLVLLMGMNFVLDGTKMMVRWAQGIPHLPLFRIEDQAVLSVLNIMLGVISVYAGYLIMRLHKHAFIFALSLVSFFLVGSLLSLDMWGVFIHKMMVMRSQITGLPFVESQVVTMQKIIPLSVLIFGALEVTGLVFVKKRL